MSKNNAANSFWDMLVVIGGSSILILFLITTSATSPVEDGKKVKTSNSTMKSNNSTTSVSLKNVTTSTTESSKSLKQTTASATLPPKNGSEGSACRKLMMIVAKRLVKQLKVCNDDLRKVYPSNEDFTEHFQCTVRCFMQNVKLVDASYQITNETLNAFVTEFIPERYQNLTLVLQQKCVNMYAYKIDVKDEYCRGHGEYLKCLQDEIDSRC